MISCSAMSFAATPDTFSLQTIHSASEPAFYTIHIRNAPATVRAVVRSKQIDIIDQIHGCASAVLPRARTLVVEGCANRNIHTRQDGICAVWGRPTMRLRPGSPWLEHSGPGRRGLHLIHRKEIDRYPRRHLDPGGLGREDHEDGALLSYYRIQLALLCPPSLPRLLLQRTLPRRPTDGVHPPAHRRILSAVRGCKGIYPGTGASPRVGVGLSLSLCLCCAA
ncbi:hypothetical protein B0H14DRAFT_1045215 [Mycena olivaceomarginata]|nr:hypothetical protein B0H14DRAFT_1045215 [Mycena olivaceomarginata]